MKIAVSYDNENIFQHFGKTENFKIYTIDNNAIISSEVVDTNGTGHEALAQFLKVKGVSVIICGGIGEGATSALSQADITIISGIEGNCDEAVNAYLKGELESKGGHCDHHEQEEEESCGGCDGGCSGCSGGCHSRPMLEGLNSGKIVRVHYRGTFDDGTQFDSSYDRGEPLEFISGAGMMIPGFDKAVVNMKAGESIDIHLSPEEAYGQRNPDAIFTVEIARLPGSESLKVNQKIALTNAYGQHFPALVTAKDDTTITFDTNHELAGKELNFHIELLEVK